MTHYLIVDQWALSKISPSQPEMVTWSPKLDAATAFESEVDAKSWKSQAGDVTGVCQIGAKWYVVKE